MENRTMTYRQPASGQVWTEALPLGNGTLGAMIYGGVGSELIRLNQDSVWNGGFRQRINPDARESLAKVRELLFEGRLSEAEEKIYTNMLSASVELGNYEPLAALRLVFDRKIPHHSELLQPAPLDYANYVRRLDLSRALFECSYERNDNRYRREAFISYPDQVMAYHIETDSPIGLRIELTRDNCCEQVLATDEGITLTGKGGGMGPAFAAAILAVSDGRQRRTGFYLSIEDATEITVYAAGRTDYYDADPLSWCRERLCAAREKGYEQLKEAHLEDYMPLFDRVALTINPEETELEREQASMPANALSMHFSEDSLTDRAKAKDDDLLRKPGSISPGRPEEDLAERLAACRTSSMDYGLVELYFNYGRYLALASSRPGSLPSNLQGLWNMDYRPQWGSRYTTNINLQMNYWPAEAGNLPECHEPLLDFMLRMLPNGRKVAREMYGCRGAVAHHNTDIYGDCAPNEAWMPASIWPMGLAWLATHVAEHFRYTRDLGAARRYYPVLAEASLFFVDYLTPGPDAEGYLVTCPSTSPENTYILPNGEKSTVCYGPTMDIQIIDDLWDGYLEVTEALTGAGLIDGREPVEPATTDASIAGGMPEGCGSANPDHYADRIENTHDSDASPCGQGITIEELTAVIREKRNLLPPMQVGSRGQLLEWREEYREFEPGHRHISHLYGLYPASQITRSRTPELMNAAAKTIRERLAFGGGQTGWSLGWIINMYARMGDGDAALRSLERLLREQTAGNLFDLHPAVVPGAPPIFQIDGNLGGTAGILELLLQSHEGCLHFLPARPERWASGRVRGLKARGNILVDFAWKEGRVTELALWSPVKQEVELLVNGERRSVSLGDK